MFKNYFKTAWRSLWKNKKFSALNIAGLSVGIACSLLIGLYVLDELSYDRFNIQSRQIYRIDEQIKFGDYNYNGTKVPAIMAPTMIRDLSEIRQYTRFLANPGLVIRKGSDRVLEERSVYADSTVFDIFTLVMIAGDKKNALKEPHCMVINESTARKYFNSLDIIGKTLSVDDKFNYKITGIIKDIPRQSHFNFDIFLPLCEMESSRDNSWLNANLQTYLLIRPGTKIRQFERRMNLQMAQYQATDFKSKLNMSAEAFSKGGNFIKCTLTPLTAIHLHSNLVDELGTNGSIQYVYIFSATAILILLIASINFMNLSIARSANRAREVGVRKVLGSMKQDLIAQFLLEALLACFLSILIAVGIAVLLLPLFNQLAGTQIDKDMLLMPSVISGLLILLILVSLISGSYPAFFLSSFQPIRVLKGNLSMGFKSSALRNSLVVIQFTISVTLMIGTLVIYSQLQYIRNKDLGFNKEQVLILRNTSGLADHTKAFNSDLLQMPEVKDITSTGYLPLNGTRTSQGFTVTPQYDGKNFTLMQEWRVDDRYLPTFQIQLKSGRNFSAQSSTDSAAVIINERAAELYGRIDPVNQTLYRITDLTTGKLVNYRIIGVIKDFNFNSLHEQVMPLVLTLKRDNGAMAVRIRSGNIPGLLDRIKNKWKSMVSALPFSYNFLDEEFKKQYGADQRREKIFLLFSILAMFIACSGLFGLVSFAARQRAKEIGIRKVMGAAIPDIFLLLSRDFLKLLLLSICISSPISWWAMTRWLQDYAYHTTIDWWMYLVVGAVCLLTALLTISVQLISAARANPVKSLKAE